MQERLNKTGKTVSIRPLDDEKLEQERARLEDEILQLRAAAKIWTEVCIRLAERGRSAPSPSQINVG